MTMSCVPTKEAQALGLVRTEEVQAVYKMPADNQPGDAVVELKFGNKEYTLHEGPAASGSRYVTSDALSPRHQVSRGTASAMRPSLPAWCPPAA